ncbi:hypothetical protein EGU77_16130, partial [Pseudomonas syringae pv. theae]|nr:hypothetical protein [Pseudomonas syringae pv. theae]
PTSSGSFALTLTCNQCRQCHGDQKAHLKHGDPCREYYYSEFPNSEIAITRFIAPTKEQRLNGSLKRQEHSL